LKGQFATLNSLRQMASYFYMLIRTGEKSTESQRTQ
jgi:hypothetical protein